MPQVKNMLGDVNTFALIEHSYGETPTFKIIENKVLGHILPETIYLAMKCEQRSPILESTKKIIFHRQHTVFFKFPRLDLHSKHKLILNGGCAHSGQGKISKECLAEILTF